MTVAFDRMAFVRALRDKPGLPPETVEAMADALHAQQAAADGVSAADLTAALTSLEQRLVVKGAIGLVGLGGFLTVIRFFGHG